MRFTKTLLFTFALVAAHIEATPVVAAPFQIINTHMKLEGACAKIFGRAKINFGATSTQPVAPLQYDTNETGACTVVVQLTDNKTSKPLEGIPVEVTKFLSTDSSGTQDKTLGTPKTDRNGNATIKFKWDPTSCGVNFRPYDPKDPSGSSLTTPSTLLTGRAFLQILNCTGTFIEQGLSRDDICNGQPKSM